MDGLEICASYVPGDWPETWESDEQITISFDWTGIISREDNMSMETSDVWRRR
jgi:hypothetical protein